MLTSPSYIFKSILVSKNINHRIVFNFSTFLFLITMLFCLLKLPFYYHNIKTLILEGLLRFQYFIELMLLYYLK